MGQYFEIMNFDKKRYMQIEARAAKLHNFNNDEDYNIAIANLIYNEWKGDKIALVGDYAGGYNDACSRTALKFIKSICDKYNFDKQHVQGWIDDMLIQSGYGEYDYGEGMDVLEIEGNTNNIHNLRYAYNHKLHEYVDFNKYSIENNSSVASPLVMLLAIGIDDERAGRWAETSEYITVEKEKIDNDYKEITYWIDDEIYLEQNSIYGCIIGGAIGDALGYPVEFLKEEQIFERYGKNGIKDFELTNGEALISDDTQMTMFTITGLLCAKTESLLTGKEVNILKYVYKHYKDWYKTQTCDFEKMSTDKINSWLMEIKKLFSKRAPGLTCISALANNTMGTIDNPKNDSKGCGGIMRVAPIGLIYAYEDDEMIASCAAEIAAITHGHPLGYISAAFLALLISKLSFRMEIETAYKHTYEIIKKMYGNNNEFITLERLLEKALKLVNENIGPIEAIHQLGEGWVAEETLAISLYCSMKFKDNFSDAIRAAVNHNGDSDSTGSVTGQIMGTMLGFEEIPEKYKENLELKSVLYELCDDIEEGYPLNEKDDIKIKKWEEKYKRYDGK